MPRVGPPWPRVAVVAVFLAAGCRTPEVVPDAAPADLLRAPLPDTVTASDAPVAGISD
jgi:hypothetical protein